MYMHIHTHTHIVYIYSRISCNIFNFSHFFRVKMFVYTLARYSIKYKAIFPYTLFSWLLEYPLLTQFYTGYGNAKRARCKAAMNTMRTKRSRRELCTQASSLMRLCPPPPLTPYPDHRHPCEPLHTYSHSSCPTYIVFSPLALLRLYLSLSLSHVSG